MSQVRVLSAPREIAMENNNKKMVDIIHGGDSLPDWMQFAITCGMFGLLTWVLYLLFHPTLELDETHRDLLNILLGTFIASFGKVIDFWFRHSKVPKE